ncbi:DUF5681 domain-containing protein [Brevundimonas sp.]|uniref:DUF5681 domain-containing protein n=1 Tax=Brevundimonas sp. TaxID=1871086 RepID=UPI002D66AB14|nr:DUF5681 domain-containing protein [Brevundimonas sp.]HYC99384.1 DUF5681 domain-containing protein [Brevundimonas sp.]
MADVDDGAPDEESVGYGRPPRHSRFKAGQSGNPSGRPRGARSLKSDLADELSQMVQVTENGSRREISKQRLALKALAAKAIKGDVPALGKLFDLLRETHGFGEDTAGDRNGKLEEDDEAVIASRLARFDPRPSNG